MINRANNRVLALCSVQDSFATYSKIRDVFILSLRELYEEDLMLRLYLTGSIKN